MTGTGKVPTEEVPPKDRDMNMKEKIRQGGGLGLGGGAPSLPDLPLSFGGTSSVGTLPVFMNMKEKIRQRGGLGLGGGAPSLPDLLHEASRYHQVRRRSCGVVLGREEGRQRTESVTGAAEAGQASARESRPTRSGPFECV